MGTFYEIWWKSIDVNFGKITMPIPYIQAIVVVFLIFLLILTLAQVRRHYVHWSFKGAGLGILLGFILTLFLEGFLLIGGRTALTEILGWENAPRPIVRALEVGRGKLVNVLGVTDPIPSSYASSSLSSQEVLNTLQSLSPDEVEKVKKTFCVE